PLAGCDLMRGLSADEVEALEAVARRSAFKAGETVFHRKDEGDELFLLLKGEVRIDLPLATGAAHHLVTFGRGDFFGEVAFLDRGSRSADAVAVDDVELLSLSRTSFDWVAQARPDLGTRLFARLAKALAVRLRQTDAELRTLQEA
ncbi:cyclic nucleotide-binding domain-containing protein, partial [bacterium]